MTFDSAAGTVHAVNGVSTELHDGEMLALVGESGSGKSVTAQAVLGLVDTPPGRIAGGRITYGGRDLLTLPRSELRGLRGMEIALVLQDALAALNPRFKIGWQIAESLRVRGGLSRRAAKRRAAELLDLVHIPDPVRSLGLYPHELSGGMRQRVMIAVALALEPRVIIADEPTTALDVTVQAEILELFDELRAERGLSIILITHDLSVVAERADRVAIMYAGAIVEQGTVRSVFEAPAHPYTIALMRSIPSETTREQRLQAVEGAPPDLTALPAGCSFHPRCAIAEAKCAQGADPPKVALAEDHHSACHFAQEVRTRGV